MAYYTPILSSILRSSILLEDVETRWLWTVMLILADESRETQGIVDTPIERLAQIANLSVEQTKKSIEHLCSPDPASRSKTLNGARLAVIGHQDGFADRKWRIVNWKLYKGKVRQMQVNAAVRRHRERAAAKSDEIKSNQAQSKRNPPTPSLTPSPSPTTKKEFNGRFAPPSIEEVKVYVGEKGLNVDPVKFCAFYESNGWKVGKNPMKKWKAACWTWDRKEQA